MEFPNLGQHCSHKECHRLDFLPMKCDLCQNIYCLDHFRYECHSCPNANEKDNQVPICPLCNQPVAVRRGELPDVRVGEHIDLDCESDPAIKKRKQIYKNKCSVKGCKQKELVPLLCTDCGRNHCLKHRHPADHTCNPTPNGTPVSKSGSAALKRFEQNKSNATQKVVQKSTQPKPNPQSVRSHSNTFEVQGNYSEDEALARALQQSMLDNDQPSPSNTTQYDRDMARAIAESQRNANRNKDKCNLS